jgi:hypothetical protein
LGIVSVTLRPNACETILKSGTIERLEQIVQRTNFECFDCVLIICGDEYDEGTILGSDGVKYLEPIHARHLNIQEHDIGPMFLDGCNRFKAVGGLRDDLDVRLGVKKHH